MTALTPLGSAGFSPHLISLAARVLAPVPVCACATALAEYDYIAQEIKKLVPEVVTGFEGELSKHETLSLTYENLVAVLTKAIQEQQEIIENLQKENKTNTEAIKKLTQQVGGLFELIKK